MKRPMIVASNATGTNNRNHWVPALVFVATFSIFFRGQLSSDWALMFGNTSDGRFVIFIHEHVFRWIMGEGNFLSPPMYFNQPNTLGYSEALLLDQLFYVPFRLAGADMYLATSFCAVALSALGYVCLYFVFRRFLISVEIAATAAAIATFSSNLFSSSVQLQHFAIHYIPAIVLCGTEAAQTLRTNPRRAMIFACVGSLLYGLLFSTSFYVAWFLTLDIMLFALMVAIPTRAIIFEWIAPQPYRILGLVLVVTITLAAALTPLFIIYIPTLRSFGYRSFTEYLYWAPDIFNIINVGPGNAVWGPLVRAVTNSVDVRLPAIAITPTVQVFSLAAIVMGFSRKFWPVTDLGKCARSSAVASGLIPFVVFALVVRWHDFSLFNWLYYFVPGAGAIRLGFRGMVVANLFATLSVALVLNRAITVLSATGGWRRRVVLIAGRLILVLLIVEQISLRPPEMLSRIDEHDRLGHIIQAPPICKSFLAGDEEGHANFIVQLDAMMVAITQGLPTLNGYSGFLPQGWSFYDTKSPGYVSAAIKWAADRKVLAGLCKLDIRSGTWTKI